MRTRTEQQLLNKLCEGLTFPQIDQALGLEQGSSHRTRMQLFRKMGVRTRHEAVACVFPLNRIRQEEVTRVLSNYRLSPRESQVLTLMLRSPDQDRKQIGEQLGIATNTVRLTVNRINKKLGVQTRAEAIAKVLDDLGTRRSPSV